MRVMSFLKKHWIKAISVVGFILALLGWLGIEPDSFKKSFIWLFNNFFKILIAVILIWLIVITIKLFRKYREVNSYEKYEKLEHNDEIQYILRVIANSKHGKMTEASINK